MSYTQSLYHIVFRTYASQQTIDERYERDLYAYLYASPLSAMHMCTASAACPTISTCS